MSQLAQWVKTEIWLNSVLLLLLLLQAIVSTAQVVYLCFPIIIGSGVVALVSLLGYLVSQAEHAYVAAAAVHIQAAYRGWLVRRQGVTLDMNPEDQQPPQPHLDTSGSHMVAHDQTELTEILTENRAPTFTAVHGASTEGSTSAGQQQGTAPCLSSGRAGGSRGLVASLENSRQVSAQFLDMGPDGTIVKTAGAKLAGKQWKARSATSDRAKRALVVSTLWFMAGIMMLMINWCVSFPLHALCISLHGSSFPPLTPLLCLSGTLCFSASSV